MAYMRSFLIAIIVFISQASFGAGQCHEIFKNASALEAASEQLGAVPHVQALFKRFLGDPDLPANFRRVITAALVENQTTVKNLTDELRAQLHRGHATNVLTLSRNRWFVQKKPSFGSLSHGMGSARLILDRILSTKRREPKVPEILIHDDEKLSLERDLSMVLYELALIRFDSFFERHLSDFARLLPKWIIQRVGDGYSVNEDFYAYVSIRYATEIEVQAAKYLHDRRLIYPPPPEWGDDAGLRRDVSETVIEVYRFQDSRILALRGLSLSEILRGHIPQSGRTEESILRKLLSSFDLLKLGIARKYRGPSFTEVYAAYELAWKDAKVYVRSRCAENVVRLFEFLKRVKPEIRSSDFVVYYITSPGGWLKGNPNGFVVSNPRALKAQNLEGLGAYDYHLVIEFQGYIFDLDYDGVPRAEPRQAYFRDFYPSKEEARRQGFPERFDGREDIVAYVIPGNEYLEQGVAGVRRRSFHSRIFARYPSVPVESLAH